MKDRAELVNAIAERLRGGARFYDCDGDGNHYTITFEAGAFVMVEGFRSSTHGRKPLRDAEDAVRVMRNIRTQGAPDDELETLAAILASL